VNTLLKLVNSPAAGSIVKVLRRRRHALFNTLLSTLPRPIRILDVGGEAGYWDAVGATYGDGVEITVTNLDRITSDAPVRPGLRYATADATHMPQFADNSFDVVFSNSVIEHVGLLPAQQAMAREVMRVGKCYFVQTPSKYFPLEPHFMVPFFQFLPRRMQRAMMLRFAMGNFHRFADAKRAEFFLDHYRLVSAGELAALFPGSTVHREQVCGLTKSVIATGGWPLPSLRQDG
jgi:hypothetical protein